MVNIIVKWRASRAIVCVKDRILLMYRKKVFEDGIIKEYYVTLGWWCEDGELYEQTLARELHEEAWIISYTVRDIICDYYHDDKTWDVGNISRQISRMYLVTIDEGWYKQTIDTTWPEVQNYSDTNIYEIHELTRTDLTNIDLKPPLLKEMLIEYAQINNFITETN